MQQPTNRNQTSYLFQGSKEIEMKRKKINLVTVLDTLDHGITTVLAAAYQCHHFHLLAVEPTNAFHSFRGY
jgi:hypothetical protein